MTISASLVKELRDRTAAGMMDCKKALEETNGDVEKAVDYLREKGLASASNKSGRIASEGLVEAYIHGGRIGVIIEVNSETDFVAKNDEFREFVKDMAMQVAAANPKVVSREELSEEDIVHEREVQTKKVINEGKPAHIADKIVEGRMEKYYEEVCLLDQGFIKDPSLKVKDLLATKISKIGENIVIRRFTRYEVGEGLDKKEEDFAEEVAKQMNM